MTACIRRHVIVALLSAPILAGPSAFSTTAVAAPRSHAEEDARITAPARQVMEELRRTYRGSAGISVIISGERTGESTGYMPSRKRLLISATGDVKVLTPSYDLTMLKGVAYMNSPFFPGYIVKARPPRVPDAAIETLEGLWPMDPLTLEVRIRLGSTVEKTFEPWLAAIGEKGTVTSTVGVFSDSAPSTALRFQGGDTDLVVWVDQATGLVRGVRGRVAQGGQVVQIDELRESQAVDRRPQVVVATTGRIPVDSFDALREAWGRVYTVPTN